MIEMSLLGPVVLQVDGQPPPAPLLWQKNLALLVYLCRSPRRGRSRDHLVGLLWPDKPEEVARHSLNQALSTLRRSLGPDLETDDTQVAIREGAVHTDLDQFESHVAGGRWDLAAALVGGELLQGLSLKEVTSFDEWLSQERRQWRDRCVEALVAQGQHSLDGGHTPEALQLAQFGLSLNPLAEVAHQLELRALALLGRRPEALERADHFARRFRDAVGAEPSAEIRRLMERIRREGDAEPPRQSTRDSSRRLGLAGRTRPLEQLLRAWQGCRSDSSPHLLIITGPAGVGKTRLIDEVLARARLDGGTACLVRAVQADLGEAGATLWALSRGSLVGAAGVAGAAPAALATLAARLPEWQTRFPTLGGMAGLPLPAALEEVVRAAAEESPVLLVVDDAHFADSQSLLGLEAILRNLGASALTVALVVDPGFPREEVSRLQARIPRDQAGAAVDLAPLDLASVRSLCVEVMPRYGPNELDRLARRIATDSAGLPLLVVELLHAVASGLELHDGAAWPEERHTLTETRPGDLPAAVVGALRVGFNRLSQPARELLKAAAVLGDRVPADLLRKAVGLDLSVATPALDELEWQRWLAAEPRGYSFVAPIAREVVNRDMVTAGQRERILAQRPAH